jgi:holliday junction DNA helicase RuvA
MIASLRGALLEKTAGTCVVEAGGVGYLVQVSTHTAAGLPAAGQEVFLRTRQIVREDAVQLFGFGDAEELELFDLMIAVSGVGPKLALAVLSGLRPPALRRAIREEQVGLLTSVPGIGKKTAERLVVELRDKLEALPAPARDGRVLPRSESWNDAVAALRTLGCSATEAQEAVRRAAAADEVLPFNELVRRALALLGKPASGGERR